jgi:hypothetical protein
MNKKELLFRFFEITGNDKDSLVYLRNFRKQSPESFALIYCDPQSFIETGESLLFNLKLLLQLELFPILMVNNSIPEYIKLFYGKLLNFEGENLPNILNLSSIDLKNDNYLENIKLSISNKKIPMLVIPEEHTDDDRLTDILKELIEVIKSRKIVYLSPERLFLDENGTTISLINYNQESDIELKMKNFSHREQNMVRKIRYLLTDKCDILRSVSVTTPISLFKELFTVKGSGTFFKLGSEIKTIKPKNVDKEKLRNLLEISFQKKVREEFLDSKLQNIILESEYRGAAIIKKTRLGSLLSKFAVDEIARGEGIGREIWDKMKQEFPSIFWRAKKNNPINKWYHKECDGLIKQDEWNIYWIGVPFKNIEKVVTFLNKLPPDFYE